MKRFVWAFASLLSPYSAHAAYGTATLTVEFVGIAGATHPVAAVRSMPAFGFTSTTQLGACPREGGKVYFEADPADKEMLAVVLAAHAAGRPVHVYWDDTHVNSRGYCKPTTVRMN